MTTNKLRHRLLASAAFGVTALSLASPAFAECSQVGRTVQCDSTTTTDTQSPNNAPNDRSYGFGSGSDVTLIVDQGAVVQGFGLALEAAVPNSPALSVHNDGNIIVDAGNTPTTGFGRAALALRSVDGDISYDGRGKVLNLGSGAGLFAVTGGIGSISLNLSNDVVGVNGPAIFAAGKDGDVSITTNSNGILLAFGSDGISASSSGAGDINIANNSLISGGDQGLNSGITAVGFGTGNITVSNENQIALGIANGRARSGIAVTGNGVVSVDNKSKIFGETVGILATSSGGKLSVSSTGQIDVANTSHNGVGIIVGNTSGDTNVNVGAGGIKADGVGVDMSSSSGDLTLKVAGDIDTATTNGFGVNANSTSGTIRVDVLAGGSVSGLRAITLKSNGSKLVSIAEGASVTGFTGIQAGGVGSTLIVNGGTLAGNGFTVAATDTSVGDMALINQKTGVLSGLVLLSNHDDVIVNEGTYNAVGMLFSGGDDRLINEAGGVINIAAGTGMLDLEHVENNGLITVTPRDSDVQVRDVVTLTGDDRSVSYTGVGDVVHTEAGNGIGATATGAGAVDINVGGNITTVNGAGILARAEDGNVSIATATGKTLSVSGDVGILADTSGAGSIFIDNKAAIQTQPGNRLIAAISANASGTGNIAVANSGALGSSAVLVENGIAASGQADVSILNTGTINAQRIGILAQSNGGALTVTSLGPINAVESGSNVAGILSQNSTCAMTVNVGNGGIASNGMGVSTSSSSGAQTINLAGQINIGAGGTDGVQAISDSGNIAVAVLTGGGITAQGDAIDLSTGGAKNVTVAADRAVTGTTAVHIGGTGATTIVNAGILSGAGPTILADQGAGAISVTNLAEATLTGSLSLSDAADSIVNAGTMNLTGTSNLGNGADKLVNGGTINLAGTLDFGGGTDSFENAAVGTVNLKSNVVLAGLESLSNAGKINVGTFTLTGSGAFVNGGVVDTDGNAALLGFNAFSNSGTMDLAAGTLTVSGVSLANSGTILADEGATTITGQTGFANSGLIKLQDGAVGDTLTVNSGYNGLANSAVALDVGPTSSDLLVINGAATGTTRIDANLIGATRLNTAGVKVVDAAPASTGVFTLGTLSGNVSPLIDYSLASVAGDTFLVSAPGKDLFDPLALPVFASSLWRQTAEEVAVETKQMGDARGVAAWGHVYASRDRVGNDSSQTVGGASFDVDQRIETTHTGIQAGVDYSFTNGRAGLTGGYGHAKGENEGDRAFSLKANGWNVGAYAQFGGATGFHGEVLAKHDRYDVDFVGGAFDGVDSKVVADGIDGAIGYRFPLGSFAVLDATLGGRHVRTKIDRLSLSGFDFDINSLKSTEGRAGARLNFAGPLAPHIEASVYREFDGDSQITLLDGASSFDLRNSGKKTWARVEAGIGRPNDGLRLSAWGEFGDRKALGATLGFRFGGSHR